MISTTTLVAIFDDEETVRKALSRLLRAAGYGVETFASGADFLGTVEQRQPHCVVLDMRMPHVGGLDVQRALQRAAPQVPVVVITGDDAPETRAQALALGAKAVLRKPVDDALLIDSIEAAIASGAAPAEPVGGPLSG